MGGHHDARGRSPWRAGVRQARERHGNVDLTPPRREAGRGMEQLGHAVPHAAGRCDSARSAAAAIAARRHRSPSMDRRVAPNAVRIAVSGAHGTGKSTLIADLARNLPGYAVAEESYYALLAEGHVFPALPSREDYELMLERSC